jgi:tRNA(Met) C34 N-acetyltransferase TmcA
MQQANLKQSDILRLYVKNYATLDLKSRRRVMGHIQAQRSKHAKEIFLKELSALGKKMKEQEPWAKDEKSRIKNKKDPLLLKLEQITYEDAFIGSKDKVASASN